MAVAALGESWYDECNGENRVVQARESLRVLAVEPRWWGPLGQIGAAVDVAYRRMPEAVNRERANALTSDRGPALASLRKADLLARQLNAAAVPLLAGNPSADLRRLLASDLLVWQGRRFLDDHWFAEAPLAPPYYRAAGSLFADDARRLDPRQGPPAKELADLQAALARPGELAFTWEDAAPGSPRARVSGLLALAAITADGPLRLGFRSGP